MATVPRVRDTLQITRIEAGDGSDDQFAVLNREGVELGRVTEEGYFLLLQMDGLSDVSDVCSRISETFGKKTSDAELVAWFEELQRAGVLNTDDRAIRILTYLSDQGVQYRSGRADRRRAGGSEYRGDEDTRRDDADPVGQWFDYGIFLLNDGMLDRGLEVFKRMVDMAPNDVRIREITKHLEFLAASEKLPDLDEERRDVSWEAFDDALSRMLASGECPRCEKPFEVELGGMNRCGYCGASFSSYVLDAAQDDRRSVTARDTA
ncbi:MAG TPA: hypothetical protein DIU15_15970 [Deltaproteobacteria bacterium]|nr:hypothetical protein [Deltaproteobacteria bacterium]HCP47539.1 hypothetical protein [Deltaproteobacteria bacterium]